MPVSMLTRGCFGMEIDVPGEKGNLERSVDGTLVEPAERTVFLSVT